MIIWINGAFGAGKTQTAYELNRRLPDSCVYDPENIGYFMNRNLPASMKKEDFQDYPLWREMNRAMLASMAEQYRGTILVPMTLVNPQYFDEIVGKLRSDGVEVKHFALCATRETLLKRLKSRGEGSGSWGAQHMERCIASLSQPKFGQHIHSDQMTIDEVVEQVASLSNLRLMSDTSGKLSKKIRRIKTQLQQIRWFGGG